MLEQKSKQEDAREACHTKQNSSCHNKVMENEKTREGEREKSVKENKMFREKKIYKKINKLRRNNDNETLKVNTSKCGERKREREREKKKLKV